jgi:hypothetical protein
VGASPPVVVIWGGGGLDPQRHPGNLRGSGAGCQACILYIGIAVVLLRTQYRMHLKIAAYPSIAFYGDLLVSKTPYDAKPGGYDFPTDDPICFHQCSGY